jgi:hypothetical protein
MAGLSLVKRREIRMPTLLGWLVLCAFMTAVAVILGRFIHPLLSVQEPASGAYLLVVEGWLGEEQLDQAVVVFRRGGYEQVITTGGPIDRWPGIAMPGSYAELAAAYLKTHGLEEASVTAVPAPASAQDRTFLSAVMAREWLRGKGLDGQAFDIYSAGVHAWRTHHIYTLAFGRDEGVGILAARPSDYEPERWWRTSVGAKTVMGESISVLWTLCCFHPPPAGSHEEKWAVPKSGDKARD